MFFYFILFSFITRTFHSEPSSKSSTQQSSLEIQYFIDANNEYSFDRVMENFDKGKTKKVLNTINLGLNTNKVWIRTTVPSIRDEQVLVISNPHLDFVNAYIFSRDKLIQISQSGDNIPFKNR